MFRFDRLLAWGVPALITLLTAGYFALTAIRARSGAWNWHGVDPAVAGMLLILLVPAGATAYHLAARRSASSERETDQP
jgi:hypothetical protein